jgi:hypothetical protein
MVAIIGSIVRGDVIGVRRQLRGRESRYEKCSGRIAGAFFVVAVRSGSHFGDFGCLRSLLTLDDLELDAITLGEGLEAASLNGAEVNEDVRASLAGDETVPFGIIEPLHGAGETSHFVPLARKL